MRTSSLVRFFLLLVVFFLLIAACIPAATRRETVFRPEAPHEPTAAPPGLDEKIAALSDLLEKEALSDRDRNLGLALLAAYQALQEALRHPLPESKKEELVNLLYEKLSTIDDNFFAITPSLQHVNQEREKILQYYLSGDHGSVIQACLDLEERFGPEALSPEVGLLFALSLGKKGLHRDALRVGEDIKRELEGNPDLVYLQAQMIEWHLALGQRTEALQIYEGLQDRLDERTGLLKKAEQSLSREESKTAHQPGASKGPGALGAEPESLDSTLNKVDALIQQHRFDQAKFVLLRQRIRIQEGPDTERIDKAMKSVEEAEERFHQEEAARLARRQETLERATRMMEQEKYDEVITQMDGLEQQGMMGTEADALRSQAIEKLVNRERNRAAKLFLMAKQAKEPSEKETLLLSSRNILKALLEKYPSSSYNEKINSHIVIIEEELAKLRRESG
jgi:hypothetical protein